MINPQSQKMLDFIHVGDYKTGTTWLQQFGFKQHPGIHFLGDYFKNREYHHLFHALVDSRDLDFDAETVQKLFQNELSKEPSDNRKIGVSREALSQSDFISGENARRNAQRLYAVFGAVKIVYVVREQMAMLKSIYSQYVKMGGTLSLRDFVFDPIHARGLIHRLQYDRNIAMYRELFGAGNVYVGLFEEFVQNRDNFMNKIYQFVGCQSFSIPKSDQNRVVNKSLTAIGCRVQRVFNRFFRSRFNTSNYLFPVDKMLSVLMPESYIKRAEYNTRMDIIPSYGPADSRARLLYAINMGINRQLERMFSGITVGQPLEIPPGFQSTLRKEFVRSNTLLVKKYHLEIDAYGWCL